MRSLLQPYPLLKSLKLIRTRYAPSPTGYLHLGHVLNACYVWAVKETCDAAVVLRMEDHDRQRCREEYLEAALQDLHWLGFSPDEGLDNTGGLLPAYRQSTLGARYEAAVKSLKSRGFAVYGCRCSRADIRARAGVTSGEVPYDGHCRSLGLDGPALRLQLPAGEVSWREADGREGRENPSELHGDTLLRDHLGQWTYQFCSVVDDLEQGISLVVRGLDIESSTGRQVLLRRMLSDAPAPLYLHHILIMRPDGQKLSKSLGDSGVRELREAGYSPQEVKRMAAGAVKFGCEFNYSE